MMDLRLADVLAKLKNREVKVGEVVEASVQRIKETEEKIQAFLTVDTEGAAKRAAYIEESSEQASLYGLPMALKDNISTKGLKTTCASKMLADFVPVYNATAVDKLNQAGAVLVGKLNLDEFAMGSSTEHSAFYPTRNPWNTEYVAGDGTAAAVAAGQVAFALGSDTGGGLRQPAAFCGVVGFKPTYGLISRHGLVASASSMNQLGTVTKNVEDTAYVLQAIAGYDPLDAQTAQGNQPDYLAALTGELAGVRIALPKEYLSESVQPEVKERILAAVKVLEGLGARCEEVSLAHTEYAVAAYYVLAASEASSNMARYDGLRYGLRGDATNLLELYQQSRSQGFGAEVKRRIILGTHLLGSAHFAESYVQAQKVRTLIKRDFEDIFQAYDCILGPTTPSTAFKLAEKADPLAMYREDELTVPASLAGLPAISVPAGLASNGLPVGLQIIGNAFVESTVLRVAHAFEQQTEHHQARPSL